MNIIAPVVITALLLPLTARAADSDGHAAEAPWSQVPSHVFRLAPRAHEAPQLSVHFGLLQPVLFRGFNAAIDLRWRRLLISYSHGQGLDYSASPSVGLTPAEANAGMRLMSPWTTGGGVGVVLIDELYVMADVKRHRYEASLDGDTLAYTTTSVGAEVGGGSSPGAASSCSRCCATGPTSTRRFPPAAP